jgi:ribosomal protein S21
MVEVRKMKEENPQRLIQRFIQASRRSGILLEKRKRLFRDRVVNETKKKESALHREKMKKIYEELKKWGKPLKI